MILTIILFLVSIYFTWSDLQDGLREYARGRHGWAAFWFVASAWFAVLTVYHGWIIHKALNPDKPAEVCKTPPEPPAEAPSP